MARSNLGDKEIMQNTHIGEDMRFRYQFPDGEVMVSDPIPPDKRKAGVITAWCEAVRGRDAAIKQAIQDEREARKLAKKKKEEADLPNVTQAPLPAAVPSAAAPTTPAPSAPGQIDPATWVASNLERATNEFDQARLAYLHAKEHLGMWERLAQALDEKEGE
jgi:hypothetical protein